MLRNSTFSFFRSLFIYNASYERTSKVERGKREGAGEIFDKDEGGGRVGEKL